MTTPTADPAEARRLADCEWYRNLAGRWDNEISFYYCDHIVFLMLGPISVVDGDLSRGPCCNTLGRYAQSLMPLTWSFPPSELNIIDTYDI